MGELFWILALGCFALAAMFAFAYGAFLAFSPAQLAQQEEFRTLFQQLEQYYHWQYELTILALSYSLLFSVIIGFSLWIAGIAVQPQPLSRWGIQLVFLWGIILASVFFPLWLAPRLLRIWFVPIARWMERAIVVANVVAAPLRWLLRRQYAGTAQQQDVLEEIDEMLESAREEGQLGKEEYQLLHNVLVLGEVQVADIMTPRTVVFFLPADLSVAEAVRTEGIQQFSRIPIAEGKDLDSTIGYVMSREVLWSFVHGKKTISLRSLARPVHTVPETMPLDRLLEEFLRRKEHLFMVADEFGGVEGLVTLEDVIETLLGVEIIDEADRVADLREVAKRQKQQRLQQRGTLPFQSGSEK